MASVEADSPAARAGLEEGDIIVAFGGVPVAGIDDLHLLLTDSRVGQAAEMIVLRRTEKLTLAIVPVEYAMTEEA